MKTTEELVSKLNKLLLIANKNLAFMPRADKKNFYHSIHSVSEYANFPPMKREDFYGFDFLKQKYSYIKRSRFDAEGLEPIIPFTKDDYDAFIKLESARFKKIGVTGKDRVSIVDFTLNETIPFATSIMQIGATYVVTEGDTEMVCHDLEIKQVNVIFTHPSMLDSILQYLENHAKSLTLKMVILSGEAITERQKYLIRIKKYLHTSNLAETIGSREIGGFAYQCPSEHYFHFLDNLYVETIDPKTKKTTLGAGELVITPLWRKDLPLIRFGTQDIIQLKPRICKCKVENTMVFEKILGRTRNNVKVGYSLLNLREIFIQAKHLLHYQYKIVDNIIWRLFPEMNTAIILTKTDGIEFLTIFVERKKFNLFLRKRKLLTNSLSHTFKIGTDIALLKKAEMSHFQSFYVDLRFTEINKFSPVLMKLMKKYRVGIFSSSRT